jgi:glycosyltransferase involved in cell wall biosynthesis
MKLEFPAERPAAQRETKAVRRIQRRPVKLPHVGRIALMIGTLNYGGAEMQATVLANGLVKAGRDVSVLVSYTGGPLSERLSADVRLHCIGRRNRWDVIRLWRRLFSTLRQESPDVLYAFMPGANLAACLAKLRFPSLKITWGVRASNVDLSQYDWGASVASWLERRLSRWPNLIIANSAAGRRDAVAKGFPDSAKFVVIPNGIDIQRFKPDAALRSKVRAEWGVLPQEILVGIVARLDPMKDHENFLRAAAKLSQGSPGLKFVSVGEGSPALRKKLANEAHRLGLEDRLIWAGRRGDLQAVHNGLDLLASSSAFGEGFSNAIGEAMACGVPCVATDVGDAREILGDVGIVVAPRNPEALATGISEMLQRIQQEGPTLKANIRRRIAENFSVERLAEKTIQALEAISS